MTRHPYTIRPRRIVDPFGSLLEPRLPYTFGLSVGALHCFIGNSFSTGILSGFLLYPLIACSFWYCWDLYLKEAPKVAEETARSLQIFQAFMNVGGGDKTRLCQLVATYEVRLGQLLDIPVHIPTARYTILKQHLCAAAAAVLVLALREHALAILALLAFGRGKALALHLYLIDLHLYLVREEEEVKKRKMEIAEWDAFAAWADGQEQTFSLAKLGEDIGKFLESKKIKEKSTASKISSVEADRCLTSKVCTVDN